MHAPEWPLLISHAIGFLITLWILKRYAWRPLLNLVEERRQKIVSEFESIDKEKQKAAELNAHYQSLLREIESQRRTEIVKAVNEGKKIAEELKASARDEAEDVRKKTISELEREVAKAKVQLKDDMVKLTVAATSKLLHEKLDDKSHHKLISEYIDTLEKA
ncbi:MAG TPA: F0F1 ATP synthase subunit B [candidate division Zixibacteria bacterium]|nr:F0F1 ATP synthase subunit B [candidate division Zixibacteria bacterium]